MVNCLYYRLLLILVLGPEDVFLLTNPESCKLVMGVV